MQKKIIISMGHNSGQLDLSKYRDPYNFNREVRIVAEDHPVGTQWKKDVNWIGITNDEDFFDGSRSFRAKRSKTAEQERADWLSKECSRQTYTWMDPEGLAKIFAQDYVDHNMMRARVGRPMARPPQPATGDKFAENVVKYYDQYMQRTSFFNPEENEDKNVITRTMEG